MAPRISRAAVQQAYKCPTCTQRQAFATTSLRLQIGPESPRYIDVPEPPQQTAPERKRAKGILPVPRDIFAGSAPGKGLDKADKDRIALSTKEPKERHVRASPDEARILWKQRMADMRRRNLKEGLETLRDRRVRVDAHLTQRGKRRQEEREVLVHQPEREDERLTNPSVDPVLQAILDGGLQDPTRAERLAQMKANVARKELTRKEEREDALHTLYMQARDFITTEAQLNQAVDDAFGTPGNPKTFGTHSDRSSMWVHGPPATVQDMLNKANGVSSRGAMSTASSFSLVARDRVKRMAEKLTGGKMDG